MNKKILRTFLMIGACMLLMVGCGAKEEAATESQKQDNLGQPENMNVFDTLVEYYRRVGTKSGDTVGMAGKSYMDKGIYLIAAHEKDNQLLFQYVDDSNSEKVNEAGIWLNPDMTAAVWAVIKTEKEEVQGSTKLDFSTYKYESQIENFELDGQYDEAVIKSFEKRANWMIRCLLMYEDQILSQAEKPTSLNQLGFEEYIPQTENRKEIQLSDLPGVWLSKDKPVTKYSLSEVDSASKYDPILDALYVVATKGDEKIGHWIYHDKDKLAMLQESITEGLASGKDGKVYIKKHGGQELSPEELQYATLGERNALQQAKNHLNVMRFSKKGLKHQLEYEGYLSMEAQFGVDHCGADWDIQAELKAREYLEQLPFSYKGLIHQLEYEGFTADEAVFGADNCGADWLEQAALKGKKYLESMAFSREKLIDQLEFEGFTTAEAEYGATANGY